MEKRNGIFLGIMFLIISFCNSCFYKNTCKVGLILPNLIDARYPKERDFFVSKIKELGAEAIVMDGNNNDALQAKQANDLIEQGVDILVIACVNKVSAAAIVRNAHKKGVKVIAYERIIDNCELDYFISYDNIKVGELMASYAIKVRPNGNYFLLCGDKRDQNAIWVRQGYENIIGPLVKSGKISVVYDAYVEDWSPENAWFEMKRFIDLTMTVPDVVLSSYDGMSSGAIKAFEESNVVKFPIITGQNAELQACQNIVKGKQSMTIYKDLKLEAEAAAELAIKVAKKEKIDIKKTVFNGSINVFSILLDPVLVDAANMKNTVVATHFHEEKEIYGQ